jgi:hypothetical protein
MRNAELGLHVVPAFSEIVATKAMDYEAIRGSRIRLD